MKRLGNLANMGGYGAGLQRAAANMRQAPQMRQAINQAIPQAINAMPWAEQQPMAPRYQTPGSIGFGAPGGLRGFGGFGGGFGGYGAMGYPSFGYGGGWPFALAQLMRRFY